MTVSEQPRRRIAIVGSGVSGLTAAYLLRKTHDVSLFESDDRLGGHAHTHRMVGSDGVTRDVDSGFIVHNDRTYPLLRRLFAELGVQARPTTMSMSIHCEGCRLEYAGGLGVAGLFAQRRRALDPRFLAMLAEVKRFQLLAGRLLARNDDADMTTYGDFLSSHRFSQYFIHHYAIPVVSCVWSSGHGTALQYPAAYLFAFLSHHGFLSIAGSPQWYTVEGGSHSYVSALAAKLDDVRVATPITAVTRKPDAVELLDAFGSTLQVDHVVIATHADDALGLLTDASDAERRILGAFSYSRNETVLHTDESLLPTTPGARAAWNYRMSGCRDDSTNPVVSYWMNQLQGLDAPEQYVVTLNATERLDPTRVEATMSYTHPIYTPASVLAQRELPTLATDQTSFAGAYHGWGFHEDGCRSGFEAATQLGSSW